MSIKGLGPNQRKVLEFLKAYPGSTIMQVAESLHSGQQVLNGDKRYNSVCRSFQLLQARGLIEKEGGQVTWKIAEVKPR